MADETAIEAPRAPLPDWLVAFGVFLGWLVLRNTTYESLPLSFGVDLLVVAITTAVVFQFERSDPPRLGWLLALLTFTCTGTGITLRDQPWAAAGSEYWMHVYFAVNVFWTSTIVVFARNILGLGLKPPWTVVARVGIGSLLLIAIGTGVYLFRGAIEAWSSVGFATDTASLGPLLMNASSAIADPTVFIGGLLIARTVLPMAGGAVARPYLLLSASAAFYLLLDVVTIIRPETYEITGQIVFSFGEGLFIAAAVSQLQLSWRDR